MKFCYVHGGESHAVELSPAPDGDKRIAIRHNGANFYAPLVPAEELDAGDLHIVIGGEEYAMATADSTAGTTLSAGMLTYDENNYSVTLNGTAQIAGDSSAELYRGNLGTADYSSSVVTVTAAKGANYGRGFSLEGNANNNTLVTQTRNVTLSGGGGENLFAVTLEGGNVITDFDASADRLSLVGGNLAHLCAIDTTGGDAKLSFSKPPKNSPSLTLKNVALPTTATVNGAQCTLQNDCAVYGNGKASVYVTPVNVDLTDATSACTVLANAGGTIQAGSLALFAGGRDVSLAGCTDSTKADRFVYGGGDVSVTNYTSANDKVSIGGDYSIVLTETRTDSITGNNYVTFADSDGKRVGKLIIEGGTRILKYILNGTDKVIYFHPDNNNYNKATMAAATGVTVVNDFADFGVLGDSLGSGGNGPGSEYYAELETITAAIENSTIIGNAGRNYIYIAGGDKNVLTGGIGAEDYYFNNGGGGVIMDFGIATAKNGTGTALATKTTQAATGSYLAYNRNDPHSYANGTDMLHFNGTVVEVAFEGYDDSSTTNKKYCTAYVTYEHEGKFYTVMLAELTKNYNYTNSNIDKATYKNDTVAMHKARIYHIDGQTSLATAEKDAVATTKAGSNFAGNIAMLDNLYNSYVAARDSEE